LNIKIHEITSQKELSHVFQVSDTSGLLQSNRST